MAENEKTITVKDFLNNVSVKNGWIIAAMTDRYMVDKYSTGNEGPKKKDLIDTESKILEIRIFDNEKEYKLFRSDIGKKFTERVIEDKGNSICLKVNGEMKAVSDRRDESENEIHGWEKLADEVQFLDIDDTENNNDRDMVTSTGGGEYHLPIKNKKNAKVRIRYYVDQYLETGQARVADWRVVELMEGENGKVQGK